MAQSDSMKIVLPPALHDFVQKKVASGEYHSTSEVISEGLRLLKHREEGGDDLAALRAWAEEGWRDYQESGGDPMDGDEFFDQLEAKTTEMRKRSA